MAEAAAPTDLAAMLDAASQFASYPAPHNDDSVKDFLERFPLPVLFSALQSEVYTPELQDAVVACLDKIFKTNYGASLLPHYAPFIQAGLQADSQTVRCLSCKAVSQLLDKAEDDEAAIQIIVEHGVYPLLINCLLDGNEQTSIASIDAIRSIAQSSKGIDIIFPTSSEEPMQLKNTAAHSSLARIRILALVVKLFSISNSVAAAVYNSNLLSLFELEISNGRDMLSTLSVMELLYELAESPFSGMFLLKTTLLQLLINMINDSSVDSMLRSRAALISGRLLLSADAFTVVAESNATSLLMAINERLKQLDSQNTDECEIALESLGLIGTTIQGANLLLKTSFDVAKHVVESSFDRQNRGKQLAALHALARICGVERAGDKILDGKAEEHLKRLIYEAAANSSKLTPSGLLLSVLQQDPEIRLAGYRVIIGLVVRQWCLREVCSKQEIISIVTDPKIETTKNGMEARHECCAAISSSLSTSSLLRDATISGITGKLQEAVKRGPYLVKKHVEAQPVVGTLERF